MLRSARIDIKWRAVSKALALKFSKPDRCKQSFRDEANINVLVKRFAKTGIINQRQAVPLKGDFTEVMDYAEMQLAIKHANDSFMSLPSDVRRRFGHDPAEFIRFTLDKENLPELRKMGLALPEAEKPPAPEPMLVRVVPDEVKK